LGLSRRILGLVRLPHPLHSLHCYLPVGVAAAVVIRPWQRKEQKDARQRRGSAVGLSRLRTRDSGVEG
jgi:hypothetical protein